MNIHIHIERLILDGLPIERRDGAAVQAAVEATLTQLFKASELSPALLSSSMIASLRAASIEFTESLNPTGLAQQIAHAVYDSLGHSQEKRATVETAGESKIL